MFKIMQLSLLIATFLSSNISYASSVKLFEKVFDPVSEPAHTSGGRSNLSGTQLADDFNFYRSAQIQSIEWLGYSLWEIPDSFRLRIFENNGFNLPEESPIYDFSLINFEAESSGFFHARNVEIIRYTAKFTNLELSDGNYWLSVVNSDSKNTFAWSPSITKGPIRNEEAVYRSTELHEWKYTRWPPRNDFAFSLNGIPLSEASSFLLMCIGLIFIILNLRLQKRYFEVYAP